MAQEALIQSICQLRLRLLALDQSCPARNHDRTESRHYRGWTSTYHAALRIASSPYVKRGILYTNYAKYFGKDDAPVLVWQSTTEEMNSTLIGDSLIEEMYLEDPDRASAEFGAQFQSDSVAFITREAVVAHGVWELPPGGGITYTAFVDPSGGSADTFTLAIRHMEQTGTSGAGRNQGSSAARCSG